MRMVTQRAFEGYDYVRRSSGKIEIWEFVWVVGRRVLYCEPFSG